tara:strand:+ start:594 stop:755 length:162 start_codon:yes stop_codon:yes gene_type:complete
MYSYIYGNYFYVDEIEKMMEEIIEDRRKLLEIGETLTTSFFQDFKLKLKLKSS